MRYFIYCRKSSEAEDRQVASIESQLSTLKRAFGDRSDIEIVRVFEEAFSAKAPGRPTFDQMLAEIEDGTADGIISWAPDRLARNSVDGGRIVFMLDRGVIKDLKFATYTFENNSQGKFMLQIMFGQSKYYSDALSENVKRGNRSKLERGWRPNQAPLGYLNDPSTKTIVRDPLHFPIIRRIFDLILSGAHSPKQVALIARDEWGFRTPMRKRSGGVPLAMSSIYKMLSNPFYAGVIVWNGQTYPGSHEPIITLDELARVRDLLARPMRPRPKSYRFAFTGMIKCGECGLSVTAEHKTNRYGSRYIYYHCVRPRMERCKEPAIERRSLESQIEEFLQTLTIDPRIERWILDEISSRTDDFETRLEAQRKSHQQALADITSQLGELTALRVRGLLTDTEYLTHRRPLLEEQIQLQKSASQSSDTKLCIEPFQDVVSFRNRAVDWFRRGDEAEKRLILETVASNLTLTGKMISIRAKKPFAVAPDRHDCPRLLGVVEDVRTKCLVGKNSWSNEFMEACTSLSHTNQGETALGNIKALRLRFEPKVVATEEAGHRRGVAVGARAHTEQQADGPSR